MKGSMNKEQERKRIGGRIAALRMARGMTQQQLADMAGLAQQNIARVETGRYSSRLDTLAVIAEALGCEVQINDVSTNTALGDLFLLEYNEEQEGFHYNYGESKPYSFGWEPIAYTYDHTASIFCNYMKVSPDWPHITTERMRKEWKRYLYVYQMALLKSSDIQVYINYLKALEDTKHYQTTAIARLGHESFSDYKEDNELLNAEDYAPMNLRDSNFF